MQRLYPVAGDLAGGQASHRPAAPRAAPPERRLRSGMPPKAPSYGGERDSRVIKMWLKRVSLHPDF